MCRTLGPCFSLQLAYSYYMDATQQGSKEMKVFSLFGAHVEGFRELLAVFAEYNDMVAFIQNESSKHNYRKDSLGFDSLVYVETELGKACDNMEIEI